MQPFNQTIGQDTARIFKTKGESPLGIADVIQPTIEIKRYCDVVRSATVTGTLYTTPTDKDFYLVAATLRGSSGTEATLSVVIDGSTRNVLMVKVVKTALIDAFTATETLSLPYPIKCDRNSIVAASLTDGSATIIGFTTD